MRRSIAIHFSLCVCVCMGGRSGWDCQCAFVTSGLVFLNCRLKPNSKLFRLLHLFSSRTPLRMRFIKLHLFGLSVLKGCLHLRGYSLFSCCYIPFWPYANSWSRSTDRNAELLNCPRLLEILTRVAEARLPGNPPWFFMSLSSPGP